MRGKEVINFFKNFTDAQVGGFCNRRSEVAPEARQNILVISLACRNLIQLILKVGGKVIFHIARYA